MNLEPRPLEPVRFLIVDDLEENLLALEAVLRRENLELVKASSGAEALEVLLQHDFALAIIDVQMPGMDGFELAELMRGTERTRRIPIIFLTAGAIDERRRFRGYESGAVDFLFKPIESQILQSKADVFFELYRQRQEIARHRDSVRENEERLRLALDGAEFGMWDWDLANHKVTWSPKCLAIFGVDHSAFNSIDAFKRLIHPEDSARILQVVTASLMEGKSIDCEFRIIRPDGVVRWIINKGRTRTDHTGKATRMIGIIGDITIRKDAERTLRESEERFRKLADDSPLMVRMTQQQGHSTYLSQAWYDYTGQSPETGLGSGWLDAVHPEEREKVADLYRDHSRGADVTAHCEYRVRTAAGGYRWCLDTVRARFESDGRFIGCISSTMDISDRRELEIEREQLLAAERAARGEVERTTHIKDEFLATLSHELRTPITAIMGWAQLLQKAPTESAVLAQGIEVIAKNAKVQAQLIADLLDMNRIVSGKLRMEIESIDLNSVILAAADTVRPLAQAKGIQFHIRPEPNLPRIAGDANRLQQVIWNLLTNAVKFTPAQGIVELRTTADFERGRVTVSVKDSGKGIDATFLPRLFERFSQAEASGARQHGGLGLGLSIVKQLVELHGGKVSAMSDGKGCGSTFTVELPVESVSSFSRDTTTGSLREIAQASIESSMDVSSEIDLTGLSLMLVDDQSETIEPIRRMLEERGATVTMAGSGAEALKLLVDEKPDVLLSDIGMPDIDGYRLVREIRERLGLSSEVLPAIAVTAFSRDEDLRRAEVAGFNAHVGKPIHTASLLTAIARVSRR